MIKKNQHSKQIQTVTVTHTKLNESKKREFTVRQNENHLPAVNRHRNRAGLNIITFTFSVLVSSSGFSTLLQMLSHQNVSILRCCEAYMHQIFDN